MGKTTASMITDRAYILLADDDPEDREMFADRFHSRNPEVAVQCVTSGYEALTYLDNCPSGNLPQLILIDYKMPGLTGQEVLHKLQHDSRFAGIPKVVWSTSNNQEFIDKSLQSGAERYFTKPADMRGFDRMVDQITQLFRNSPEQGSN
jgi:CheY-like chemotaxis protein